MVAMAAGDAKRKRKHLDEWMPKFAKRFHWSANAWDYFAEFRSSRGGGLRGVDAQKSACRDIRNVCDTA